MNRRHRHMTGRIAAWILAIGGGLTIVAGALLIAESVGVYTVPNLNVSIADGGIGILIGAAALALSLQAHAIFDTAMMIETMAQDREAPSAKRSMRKHTPSVRSVDGPVLTRKRRFAETDIIPSRHAAE